MNRDTHDINEYEKEKKLAAGTNIQPQLIVNLIKDSEPTFFNGESKPVVLNEYFFPPQMIGIYKILLDTVKWHAKFQVDFDKSVMANE